MATRIQLRRDTAANWESVDPVLAAGEIGINSDTKQHKVGDGSSAWTVLDYAGREGGVAAPDIVARVRYLQTTPHSAYDYSQDFVTIYGDLYDQNADGLLNAQVSLPRTGANYYGDSQWQFNSDTIALYHEPTGLAWILEGPTNGGSGTFTYNLNITPTTPGLIGIVGTNVWFNTGTDGEPIWVRVDDPASVIKTKLGITSQEKIARIVYVGDTPILRPTYVLVGGDAYDNYGIVGPSIDSSFVYTEANGCWDNSEGWSLRNTAPDEWSLQLDGTYSPFVGLGTTPDTAGWYPSDSSLSGTPVFAIGQGALTNELICSTDTGLIYFNKNPATESPFWVSINRRYFGLDQVDNTADFDKPVSGPQLVYLSSQIGPKAGLNSPNFANFIQVNSTAPLSHMYSATASLNFGSVAANSSLDLTMTLTGVVANDDLSVSVPSAAILADLVYSWWISASNQVTIRCTNNNTTTARDPGAGTFRATAFRFL